MRFVRAIVLWSHFHEAPQADPSRRFFSNFHHYTSKFSTFMVIPKKNINDVLLTKIITFSLQICDLKYVSCEFSQKKAKNMLITTFRLILKIQNHKKIRNFTLSRLKFSNFMIAPSRLKTPLISCEICANL